MVIGVPIFKHFRVFIVNTLMNCECCFVVCDLMDLSKYFTDIYNDECSVTTMMNVA